MRRNSRYVLDQPLTDESVFVGYTNFGEFSMDKEKVAHLVDRFVTHPWQVEIAGLVARPGKFCLDDLQLRLPIEQRLYRHRCVEGWACAIPWSGFQLSELLCLAQPLPAARFVRFISFKAPEQAPNMKFLPHLWPYVEGLSLPEAMHELAFMATGAYGHALTKQNGAPLRLAVPWKYGYKSAKSIVRIELVEQQPAAFWSLLPSGYDFVANVSPDNRDLIWPQATELVLGTGERRPTIPFNGYGEWVAKLY